MDRRNFLWASFGMALGVGSTTAAAFTYRHYRRKAFLSSLPPPPPPSGYAPPSTNSVWLLSSEDFEQLASSDYMYKSDILQIVENSEAPGMPFLKLTVTQVDDCIYACENDERCTRFTFAKTTHPDPQKRNACWLKPGEGSFASNGARHYVSGWR